MAAPRSDIIWSDDRDRDITKGTHHASQAASFNNRVKAAGLAVGPPRW